MKKKKKSPRVELRLNCPTVDRALFRQTHPKHPQQRGSGSSDSSDSSPGDVPDSSRCVSSFSTFVGSVSSIPRSVAWAASTAALTIPRKVPTVTFCRIARGTHVLPGSLTSISTTTPSSDLMIVMVLS